MLSLQLSLSSIVYVQVCPARKYSPNSRCRPPSCLLAVFAMFLAINSPRSSCSSYSWNGEWSVRHFSFHNLTTKTTQSRPQVFLVNSTLTCRSLHFWRQFLVKHKILPKLVMVNYACASRQSELGKYFEWIIMARLPWWLSQSEL